MVAYKREGYEMFEEMIAAIQEETVRRVCITGAGQGTGGQRGERVAKVTGESGGGDGTVKKQPSPQGPEDRPQRPLPLRQRPEVEEVHLRRLPREP